jgi:hypothetical protein
MEDLSMSRVSSLRSAAGVAAAVVLAVASSSAAPAQKQIGVPKRIAAVATGTSAQLGRIVNVDITIGELSPPEDQRALAEAFRQGGSAGLARAVSKMSSRGRIAITGTLGYDINYIRVIETPAGRKIRFITDRPITFGERLRGSRSGDYDLSAGEIEIPAGKGKVTGVLLPACRFGLDKQNQLELELLRNPWKLVNVSVHD